MALMGLSSSTALSSSSSSTSTHLPPLIQCHRTHFPPRRIVVASALPRELHYHPETHTTTPPIEPPSTSTNTTREKITTTDKKKKKNKPRPSFLDQIMERWSLKVPSERTNFPWQGEAQASPKKTQVPVVSLRNEKKRVDFANEIKGPAKSIITKLGVEKKIGDRSMENAIFPGGSTGDGVGGHLVIEAEDSIDLENCEGVMERMATATSSSSSSSSSSTTTTSSSHRAELGVSGGLDGGDGRSKGRWEWKGNVGLKGEEKNRVVETKVVDRDVKSVAFPRGDFVGNDRIGHLFLGDDPVDVKSSVEVREDEGGGVERFSSSFQRESYTSSGGLVGGDGSARMLPWKREGEGSGKEGGKKKSNTEMAERLIPAPELQRLRNVSLRMKERTKVGSAGVTEALVGRIKDKWRENEVVKLRFEGQPAINMRRIHEALEKKTGGLVIWRSGASVVLYRGMSYNLPCVQSYTENIERENFLDGSSRNLEATNGVVGFGKYGMRTASNIASSAASNIDSLLDELGPRYRDWAGRDPLPVDADLLPHVIPGYVPPFRFLPHRAKRSLRNSEMTYLRRLARSMPPHFALGRNRDHHGLACAMVMLWEKSLIAKIAIKRGVPNTCNDRMAEEIKTLTGGVLLSRNKEFIVVYRGNDFVPSSIQKKLEEREKLSEIRQDEEEKARQEASSLVMLNDKAQHGPRLAGTLAETIKAKTHWANEPSKREIEKMMADDRLSKHESIIRYMERKLSLAHEKVRKAEKALAKVQEALIPRELPSDLEMVSDEERALFRKMGLKMRSFLTLGRRGVFDGTIENMHLNWKYRELVKILVRWKSFAMVKHIAISLEAESGGVLISLDKTTKGYAIIVYRGKNYQRPDAPRPKNLLSRRQALARSIELQRREALKYHISKLRAKIWEMKAELDQMRMNQSHGEDEFAKADGSDDGFLEEEGEEAYLETFQWHSDDDDEDRNGDDSAAAILPE